MSNLADQPAFPDLTYNETTGKPDGHNKGMTLRQYYAGQEKSKVPDWFKQETLPNKPIFDDTKIREADGGDQQTFDGWRKDPCWDLAEDIKWMGDLWEAYQDDLDKWEQNNKLSRIAQWKLACADALISELSKQITP